MTLADLCSRVRPELARLGESATPLVTALGVVEQIGAGRDLEALTDPTFPLDVFTAMGPAADPAVVGRLLDFLRSRTSAPTAPAPTASSHRRPVTLTEAVEQYEATTLALLAKGTQRIYRSWLRRLVAVHGDDDPAMVTAGDLKDVIAKHVLAIRQDGGAGRVPEQLGVAAFRSLWNYMGDKRWVTDNVARRLRKPPSRESARRGWRPEEAALARHLARGMNRPDPLLNEVTLGLSERMGLRREESHVLRICDIDWQRAEAKVTGKGDKPRVMPIPPVFLAVLRTFVEERRPADVSPADWLHSEEHLLRFKPSKAFPHGRRVGYDRVDRLMAALRQAAPDVFPADELFLHTFRHALGTWCEANYTRTLARRALGHTSNQDATDSYLKVTDEQLAEAFAAYEQHLLAADPHHEAAA